MNYNNYLINAVYKETNRKRKRSVKAKSESQAIETLKSKGYIEPFEVKFIPHSPPTENQVNYAKKLGINIPEEACVEDVSALISRAVDNDSEPNEGLIEFADNRGFFFSKYVGKKFLYNFIFRELDDKDRVAFFIFSVYRYLSDDRHANLDTSPYKGEFFTFADEAASDKSFMNSMNRLEGQDLRFFGTLIIGRTEIDGTSTDIISYKKAVAYLKDINLLKGKVSSVKRIKGNPNKRNKNSSNQSLWSRIKDLFFPKQD